MSSLVFPAPLAGQFGMSWPIRKTPLWKTIIQTPASGRGELRIPLQSYPRWQFDLDVSYLTGDMSLPNSYLATLLGFYLAAQGGAADWLYQDPYDNAVTNEQFGVGDGATTEFQLVRNVGGANGFEDIIQNLLGTPVVTLPSGTASVGPTGIVTYSAAPPNGTVLYWSGGFYYRCRFNDDSLPDLQEDLFQIWSLKGLKFISVIL